jgi:hypothetical protein
VLICSACLDKIVSNRVNDSCINLINVCSCVLFADFWCFSIISGRWNVCHFRSSVSGVRQGFCFLILV